MEGAPVPVLIVRTGTRRCALRAAHVIETMRPLPVEPMGDAPAVIRGLSVIRGAAVPVVDLARLLGEENPGSVTRYVTVRAGARSVALAVGEVLDLVSLEPGRLEGLPAVLPGGGRALEAIGVVDSHLLPLLEAARLVPDSVWAALERTGA